MISFLRDVVAEIGKVSWPTRTEVVRLTSIVLGLSLIVGIYLGGVDLFFTTLLEVLIK